ncbi:hypothetical protein LINPERPRIM_LOCUS20364 [Linum perenne]
MCYKVKCSSCGKTSWGGCGRHVQSVYKQVPQAQRCICKDWPGVIDGNNPTAPAARPSSSSSCSIM